MQHPQVAAPTPSAFDCSRNREFANGQVIVTLWANSQKAITSLVVQWTPSDSRSRELRAVAIWEAHAASEINWAKGLVMLDRENGRVGRAKLRTLELRATAEGPWEGYAAFRSKQKLENGIRLSADWEDVLGMANGTPQLFLVARDGNERVVETLPLDKSMFAVPFAEIDQLIDEAKAAATSPEEDCFKDESEGIIVT